MLVISSSCSGAVGDRCCCSGPYSPMTPPQETLSEPTLALKSPRMMSFRNSSNGRVKFLIEFELHFIRVGHGGSIGTDDGKMLPSKREGEFHGHKPVVHSIGRSSQLASKSCLHCKANTSLKSLVKTPLLLRKPTVK